MEDSAQVQNLDSQERRETFQEEREEFTQAMTQREVTQAMTMIRMLPLWPRPTLWQKSAPILGEWRIELTWKFFVQKGTFLSHYPNQKLVSNQQRDFGRSGMEEVMVVAMGAAMEEDTVEVMAKGLALEQPVLSRSIFCSQKLFLQRSRPIYIYQTRNLKGFCSDRGLYYFQKWSFFL